jgi:8-oxo-dGTP pyrophosphatase MutT (NUDIX family)
MVVKCVGAILIQAETLLLGRRAPHLRSYPNCWDIIGGHVEAGETFEQTLVREAEEEIGVTPVAFIELASLQFAEGLSGTSELHVYRVDAWTGGAPAIRDDEHAELRWFTVEAACALPDLASVEYLPAFRAIRRHVEREQRGSPGGR